MTSQSITRFISELSWDTIIWWGRWTRVFAASSVLFIVLYFWLKWYTIRTADVPETFVRHKQFLFDSWLASLNRLSTAQANLSSEIYLWKLYDLLLTWVSFAHKTSYAHYTLEEFKAMSDLDSELLTLVQWLYIGSYSNAQARAEHLNEMTQHVRDFVSNAYGLTQDPL